MRLQTSRMGRLRGSVVGIAACAAVTLCTSAVAIAGGGFSESTRSASTSISGGGEGSVTARCPLGQRVVGGGFESDFAPAATSPALVPNELARPAGRAWQVSAANTRPGPGTDGNLTAVAVCGSSHLGAHKAPKIVVRTGTQTVEPRYTKPATAACPKGKVLAFAGYRLDPWDPSGAGPHLALTGLGPSRNFRTLAVFAANTGSKTGTVEAIAYCAKGQRWTIRTKVRHLVPGTSGSATATCPPSRSLLFGGAVADVDSFGGGSHAADYLTAFRQVSRRSFRVAGVNLGPGTGFVTALAFCR